MTFTNQTNHTSAVGTNTIGQEVAFLFPISDTSDLEVKSVVTATGVETLLDETTNYTVAIVGDTGGTVTMVTAVAVTSTIHVRRATPLTQELDLVAGGTFNAENVEDALDKVTKLAVDNKQALNQCLRLPNTDSESAELTTFATRAGKFLYFSAIDGEPTVAESVTTGDTIISAFGGTLIDDANAGAALTTLGVTAAAKTILDDATTAAIRTTLGVGTTDTPEFAGVLAKTPWINVQHSDYGATADGATECSTEIQAAIDAAELIGGVVLFPPGTYIVDTEITVDAKIHIVGPGAILKQKDAANQTNVLSFDGNNAMDFGIWGLKIDGNMDNNTAVIGIRVEDLSTGWAPINCSVTECDIGMLITGNFESQSLIVNATWCGIGLKHLASTDDHSPNENYIILSGHSNGTHYYQEAQTDNACSANVHFACEASSGDAVYVSCDNIGGYIGLSGEIRGCSDDGVVIESGTSINRVIFDNLLLNSTHDLGWGIKIDDGTYVSGSVIIQSFASGCWIKKASSGSLNLNCHQIDSGDGLRLGEEGVTTVARFTVNSGLIATGGANAVHFEDTYSCRVNAAQLSGATYDGLFDTNSRYDTITVPGHNIDATKYLGTGAGARVDVIGLTALQAFANVDATPSVLVGGPVFKSGGAAEDITGIDDGYIGQVITIVSQAAITYDTTGTNLYGSSVNIVTAAGDVTQWCCLDGTKWYLVSWIDISKDNSVTT